MPIYQDNRKLLQRLSWLRYIFIMVFLCLVAKLWSLTVLDFEHYRSLAERNRVRTLPELAPRGLIYDRDGRVFVDNIYELNLLLFRDDVEDLDRTVGFLVQGLGLPQRVLQDRLGSGGNVYRPLVVKENLSMEQAAYFLARQSEYPELRILKQPRRIYRYGELGAHVAGYVGEVSESQLETSEFEKQKAGDLIGQAGLERTKNGLLAGKDGRRQVLVDSRGKVLEEIRHVAPVRGKEVRLTLDLDLQAVAESQLGDQPGAVFAFDPRSGEVLAMANRPTFDPNQFARRITQEEWQALLNHADKPLQNRTIQTAASPGSIFKLVMALAGLESGVVDPRTEVFCGGSVGLYGQNFQCWKPGGHGRISLHEAIQHSCNVYFYLLGQKLGLEQIAEYSRRMGLGSALGLDILGEVSGLVPTEEWKQETQGEPWYAGETISLAIGQGPLLVTPVQLARAVGMIATGKAPPMSLVLGQEERRKETTTLSHDFSPVHLQVIRDAMWSVVNEGGTGTGARLADFEVSGKTGTAQTISSAARQRLSEEDAARFEPNSWFVGFAPREKPAIVVVVLVERGGSGGGTAAPIAREVFRTYYEKYQKGDPAGVEVVLQISGARSL